MDLESTRRELRSPFHDQKFFAKKDRARSINRKRIRRRTAVVVVSLLAVIQGVHWAMIATGAAQRISQWHQQRLAAAAQQQLQQQRLAAAAAAQQLQQQQASQFQTAPSQVLPASSPPFPLREMDRGMLDTEYQASISQPIPLSIGSGLRSTNIRDPRTNAAQGIAELSQPTGSFDMYASARISHSGLRQR